MKVKLTMLISNLACGALASMLLRHVIIEYLGFVRKRASAYASFYLIQSPFKGFSVSM